MSEWWTKTGETTLSEPEICSATGCDVQYVMEKWVGPLGEIDWRINLNRQVIVEQTPVCSTTETATLQSAYSPHLLSS